MRKLGFIASQISLLSVFATSVAHAQENVVITPPNEFVSAGNITPNSVISFILGLLLAIGVLAAVGFLIWGAIKWITSGGDKGKVDAARNTIVAAVIGLIVLLLSFVIINFAIQIVGAGNGIFDICIPSLNGAKTCR